MNFQKSFIAVLVTSSFFLSGCVDFSSKGPSGEVPQSPPPLESEPPSEQEPEPEPEPEPASAPEPTTADIQPGPNKQFLFSWTSSPGSEHYKLLENPDGMSGFTQVGSDIPGTDNSISIHVPLFELYNGEYLVDSCNSIGCNSSNNISSSNVVNDAIGFIKAINSDSADKFGNAIDVSGDGITLAIGHQLDDTDSSGGSADPAAPNDLYNSGSVHIYKSQNGLWVHDGYIKADNSDIGDQFGGSLSISHDGTTMVVSARREQSLDPLDPLNNDGTDVGAIYVFEKTNDVWAQTDYIKPDYQSFKNNNYIGDTVRISGDGNTLAFSVKGDRSDATIINGDQNDTSATSNRGAIWVYTKDIDDNWVVEAYLKRSYPDAGDNFGSGSFDMSEDGSVIVAGANAEDSCSTVVNGDQSNDDCADRGAAIVFEKTSGSWAETTFLKPSNSFHIRMTFGSGVSISRDGSTIAVAAISDRSLLTGINPIGMTDDTFLVGAVYVFVRSAASWVEEAYIKPSNTLSSQQFSTALTLDADGNTLVVGAVNERSTGIGIQGDDTDQSLTYAGAAYVFKKNNYEWTQKAYLKAPNSQIDDRFGSVVAISDSGTDIFIQSPDEDGPDAGGSIVDPQYSENTNYNSGAVYVY